MRKKGVNAVMFGTKPPSFTSMPVVDFTTTQLLAGTIVVEMDFITSLRMGVMCFWNPTRLMNVKLLLARKLLPMILLPKISHLLKSVAQPMRICLRCCLIYLILINARELLLTKPLGKIQIAPVAMRQLKIFLRHQSEETLINLYLSGYNQASNAAKASMMSLEMDGSDSCKISANGAGKDDIHMVGEGEIDCITEGHCSLVNLPESTIDEASRDEENWRAQYGQVVQPAVGPVPNILSLDLWDWEMVRDCRKEGKSQVARLVGRLVKRSAKLHPSVPSSGGLFRTAPICEAHLDLVRVKTGQVYRLHNPSARHLASLLTYDSSNPTKDWGFPELSIITEGVHTMEPSGTGEPSSFVGNHTLPNHNSASKKPTGYGYRDRAAERRTLHGGFGLGPGQKILSVGDVGDSSSYLPTEEAAAEALNISFGSGSYARRILESMGWKEGEGLGKTTKGLVEPIEGVRNVGSAGLGWPQGGKKHHY